MFYNCLFSLNACLCKKKIKTKISKNEIIKNHVAYRNAYKMIIIEKLRIFLKSTNQYGEYEQGTTVHKYIYIY